MFLLPLLQSIEQLDQFLPSIAQFIVTGMMVIALIIVAFIIGKHKGTHMEKAAPHPWFVATITLVLLSMHTFIELLAVLFGFPSDMMMEWPGVILRLMLLSLLGYLILHWSKRKGWGAMHYLALASGAILTRAWVAYLIKPLGNVSSTDKLIGNTIFLTGAIILILWCAYLIRKK